MEPTIINVMKGTEFECIRAMDRGNFTYYHQAVGKVRKLANTGFHYRGMPQPEYLEYGEVDLLIPDRLLVRLGFSM